MITRFGLKLLPLHLSKGVKVWRKCIGWKRKFTARLHMKLDQFYHVWGLVIDNFGWSNKSFIVYKWGKQLKTGGFDLLCYSICCLWGVYLALYYLWRCHLFIICMYCFDRISYKMHTCWNKNTLKKKKLNVNNTPRFLYIRYTVFWVNAQMPSL